MFFFMAKKVKPVPIKDVYITVYDAENKPKPNKIPNKNAVFRPKTFDDYVGQEEAKSILTSYIEGSKSRQRKLPHLLIHGPAGCGKTTLVKVIANILNVKLIELIGSTIQDANYILSKCKDVDGGILFIDEIHAIKREQAEILYPIMEDFSLEGESISPFTLIGATTEIGEIIQDKRPLYDRFVKIELADYTVPDIRKIVKQYAERIFPNDTLNRKAFDLISKNARLTPRKGINILQSTIYLNGDIAKVLKNFGIIWNGYTYKDLKTLDYMKLNEKGVGIETLATYLNTSRQNYVYEIEPWLLGNKLVIKGRSGRKITEEGKHILTVLRNKTKGENHV